MNYKSKLFPGLRNEILKLLQQQYPNIYEKLNLEEHSLLSFLINVQTWLTETELYYLGSALKESLVSTARQGESILWHAYSSGYKPKFAIPASGIATLIIPIVNTDTGEILQNSFEYIITPEDELYGLSIRGNDVIPYRTKYTYKILYSNNQAVIYKYDDVGNESLIGFSRTLHNFSGVLFDSIAIDLEVEQISERFTIEEIIRPYSNFNFPTIELPIPLDEIERLTELQVYVNDEEAIYEPVVFLFDNDKYNFTIRYGEIPSLLLSNGLYGKKVIPGSNVKIIYELTEGEKGIIQENSLVFRSAPIDQLSGSSLLQYVFLHPPFSNGSYTEHYDSIRKNTIRTLRSNERLVTAQDYKDLIERDFNGVKVFPVSRQTDFNTNEIAVYLAFEKYRDDSTYTLEYYKTDTKSIVITTDLLQNAGNNGIIKTCGSLYLIPAATILEEDIGIHYSGHFVRPIASLDLNNLPTNCDGQWVSLFIYELDLNNNTIKAIFNPPTYSYQTNTYKTQAVYQGMIIESIISPLSINLDAITYKYIIRGVIDLKFSGNLSNFNLLLSNPVETWLNVKLQDIVNGLNIEINPPILGTYNVISQTSDSLSVEFEVAIDYQSVTESIHNINTIVKFKFPSEPTFNTIITEGKTPNMLFKFDFTAFSNPKLQYVQEDVCKGIFTYKPNDYIIIHDVPVFSLYELLEYDYENMSRMFFDKFIEISKYTQQRAVVGTETTCLLSRTFGFSYIYKYLSGITNDLTLPVTIEANITIDPSENQTEVMNTVKNNIKKIINTNSEYFIILSRLGIFSAINEDKRVLSADIINPTNDIIFRIPSIDLMDRCDFRVFVPEIYNTTDNLIQLNVLNP